MRRRNVGAAVIAIVAGLTAACDDECFVRGTLVRTPHGDKAIEALAIGDEVLSFVEATMELVVRRVTALHAARVRRTRTIVVVDLAGREKRITTTDEHPFWEAERRAWIRARALTTSATLAMLDPSSGKLMPVRVARLIDNTEADEEGFDVFNLTVEGPEHTYLANGVAVHNKSLVAPGAPAPSPSSSSSSSSSPSFPPPPPASANEIQIQNTMQSNRSVEVKILATLDGAIIDNDLLQGSQRATFTLPEAHFTSTPPVKSASLSPQQALNFPAGHLTVFDTSRGESTSRAAVVEVDGERIVAISTLGSNGQNTVLKIGDGPTFTSDGGLWIRKVARNEGLLCSESAGANDQRDATIARRITLPESGLATSNIGQRFVVNTTRTADCIAIRATLERDNTQVVQAEACGNPAVWPFAEDEVVTIERPRLIEGALPSGLRFVRVPGSPLPSVGAKNVIELAHVAQRSTVLLQPNPRVSATYDGACVVQEKQGCASLTVRTELRDRTGDRLVIHPNTILEPADGAAEIFLFGATRTLYSLNCPTDFGITFDVVARE